MEKSVRTLILLFFFFFYIDSLCTPLAVIHWWNAPQIFKSVLFIINTFQSRKNKKKKQKKKSHKKQTNKKHYILVWKQGEHYLCIQM